MKCRYIIGIDEVGRGPLAGPLCVGACMTESRRAGILARRLYRIKDSKQLSEKERGEWFWKIQKASCDGHCSFRTVFVGEQIIDAKGIGFAIRFAIKRVLQKLAAPKDAFVILDGRIKAPSCFRFQETIIRGDEKEPLIAAASIVAKVRRDLFMIRLSRKFPEYGFEKHKGYGTKEHYDAIKRHGICEMHRKSFLKDFLNQ